MSLLHFLIIHPQNPHIFWRVNKIDSLEKFDVICVGIITADIIASPFTQLPERGTLSLVNNIILHPGGCVLNAAIGLSRLGLKVAVSGCVGGDTFGEITLGSLKTEDVNIENIKIAADTPTSCSIVLVYPDGERSFVHASGANAIYKKKDFDITLLDRTKYLLYSGAFAMPGFDGQPAAELFKTAKLKGVTTFLDTIWNDQSGWMETLKPVLEYTDFFMPSELEAQQLTGQTDPAEAAKKLRDFGVKTVIIKLGERGCYALSQEETFTIPAFKVKAIDGTGAGDAFTAGFIAATDRNLDLFQSAQFGNKAGACSVQALGGSQNLRSFEEIDQMFAH